MYSAHFSRLLAVPVVTAGIIGATTLGHIATAHADIDDDYYSAFDDDYDYAPANEIFASPDTYADPASSLIPWGQWINDGMVTVPQVDNTVQQSR